MLSGLALQVMLLQPSLVLICKPIGFLIYRGLPQSFKTAVPQKRSQSRITVLRLLCSVLYS